MQRRVVFLCTGNYYRSRYAELYFNARVSAPGSWTAVSRGFQLSPQNQGPIAESVLDRLRRRQIAVPVPIPAPRQLDARDLSETDHVIALDETEHRPYVERALLGWHSRVIYWNIPDVPGMPVDHALDAIERAVDSLLQTIELP